MVKWLNFIRWEPVAMTLEGVLLTIYSVAVWVGILWLIGRGRYRPVGVHLASYAWNATVEPVLMWLWLVISRRRSKLIARFLQRADDLRMRDQPINESLPRLPGGSRGPRIGEVVGPVA